MIQDFSKHKIYDSWFWILLAVGVALRFVYFNNLPFTHDEYSVIFRLKANSFFDLIEKGVVTDTHPPFVQVFIFYWTKLFGLTSMSMKLPFVLLGCGALVVFYRLVYAWSSIQAARMGLAWMAVAQYMIYYTELARPYSFGLFIVLLLALQLTHVVQQQQVDLKRYFFILMLIVAAAYTHYFSMMQAGLLWAVAVWATFSDKQKRKHLLLVAFLAVLLFLPYLPVFFLQVNKKGVEEWLGKPTPIFLFSLLKYAFHFSGIFAAAFLVTLGLFFNGFSHKWKIVLSSLALFVIPFLIGYGYSIFVAALLQFSVLIFAFPFLLLGLFVAMDLKTSRIGNIAMLAFVAIGIFTLVYSRQHYNLMQVSAFKEITQKAHEFETENFPSILTITEKIGAMELAKYESQNLSLIHFANDSNFKAIATTIAKSTAKKLFIGWAHKPFDWRLLTCAQQWGYSLEKQTDYFNGNSFELSYRNTKNLYYNTQSLADEFVPVQELKTDVLDTLHGKVLIVFSAVIAADSIGCQPVLVCDVKLKNGQTDWHGSRMDEFPAVNGVIRANLSFAIDCETIHSLNCYIWNPTKCTFQLLDSDFKLKSANPVMYGFFEKIK